MSNPIETGTLPIRSEWLPIIGNYEFGLTVEDVELARRSLESQIQSEQHSLAKPWIKIAAVRRVQRSIQHHQDTIEACYADPEQALARVKEIYDAAKRLAEEGKNGNQIASQILRDYPDILSYEQLLKNNVEWGNRLYECVALIALKKDSPHRWRQMPDINYKNPQQE